MLRVLLVNPPPLSILEPWYDAPSFGRTALACLASYLREKSGEACELKIIDAKFERLDFQGVLERALSFRPDVVGLTAFTNEIKPAAYQAALIKRALPQALTVIGGVHVTALPEQTLREFPSFDVGVIGEGEAAFHELCEAVGAGGDWSRVPGLVYRRGGGMERSAARGRELELDSLPLPAWDLLPPAGSYMIQSQRGCPFDCQFCMNPNGRVARQRSVANVMAELELLTTRYRPEHIRFGDEIFSVDLPRTRRLLSEMIRTGVGARVPWIVQTHVRYVDGALFAQMREAGVLRVEMGVETGMEAALKTMGKGTDLPMIRRAFAAARAAGVATGAFFLFGQPDETAQSFGRTAALAADLNPDLPIFGLMTPYPGTEVAELAARSQGGYRLLTTDWDEYNKQIGGALEFAGLSRTQIEVRQLAAYALVFLKNARFLDFLRFLWEYRGGMWTVLKKIARRSKSVAGVSERPADYERTLSGGPAATHQEIVAARAAWAALQRAELMRSRGRGPAALKA